MLSTHFSERRVIKMSMKGVSTTSCLTKQTKFTFTESIAIIMGKKYGPGLGAIGLWGSPTLKRIMTSI